MAFDLDDDELRATREMHKLSDKNVASEEEKLMKSLEYELDRIIEKSSKVETAAEIAYLRQQIILMFLKLLKEREQDKKRIQELEEERQIVGMPVRNKRSGKIGVILHKWESGSIAVLEKISPRVINTHENMSTLEVITDKVIQEQTIDNVEGGDKNVASIDDDINKLNKFCEYEDTVVLCEEALYEIQEAIERILSEREQDKKKIKELEEKNKILNCQNKQVENYAEELKKYNKTVSDRIVEYKKNSIPVQKVKDELETLRKMLKATMSGKLQEYTVEEIIIKINTLEELLEGE